MSQLHPVQARRPATRLPRERRVSEIMEAARAVFEEHGYHAAPLSEIAERAGVVEGTIYRYFDNKRDLLVRVLEQWFEELLAENADLASISDTRERLRTLVWRHLTSIRRQPALSRLMFMEIRPDPGYRATRLHDLNRAYTHQLTELVRAGVSAGEFAADVPATLARDMLYGCIEHHTWAFLRGEGDFSVDAAADAITALVHRGLGAGAEAQVL
jgi:TetR/AcrR family transcriptional regulator, fatty acid metabolism regulator protein